jgi:hypothetical protein
MAVIINIIGKILCFIFVMFGIGNSSYFDGIYHKMQFFVTIFLMLSLAISDIVYNYYTYFIPNKNKEKLQEGAALLIVLVPA